MRYKVVTREDIYCIQKHKKKIKPDIHNKKIFH